MSNEKKTGKTGNAEKNTGNSGVDQTTKTHTPVNSDDKSSVDVTHDGVRDGFPDMGNGNMNSSFYSDFQ